MSIINWLQKKGLFYHLVYDAELRLNYGILDELFQNHSLFNAAPDILITTSLGRVKLTFPQKFYDWDNKIFPLIDNSLSPMIYEHGFFFPFISYHSDNRSVTITWSDTTSYLDLTTDASLLFRFKILAQSEYPNKFKTYY